jgi:hypothetical protein
MVVLSFQIHGLLGLIALVVAGVGGLAVSWAVAFVSASLWGCYYHWRRPSFRYAPGEPAEQSLFQRVLGIDDGPALVAGVSQQSTTATDSRTSEAEDSEFRGIQ